LYLSTQQKQYHQESLVADEYKISNIFIDDFKMFKNFTLNLVGTDKKPLPLIVLAGKNGTGKTSILELIKIETIASLTLPNNSEASDK
jgi:recombinational DNA repair ATPase RecF